jgi:hypothetical protein
MTSKARYLWAAIAATLGSTLLVVFDLGGPLRPLLAIPLALLLPGYALTAACFPGASLGASERLLASLGLSLALSSLGGLMLFWAGLGLQPTPWALLLGALTLASCVVALWRRRASLPASPETPRESPQLGQIALLALAALLSGGALFVAHSSARQVSGAPFTQLWAVPTGDPGVLRIGVRSAEDAPLSYRVELSAGAFFFERWPRVMLAPGESWEKLLAVPPHQPIELRLYRHDNSEAVYRRVTLERAAPAQE